MDQISAIIISYNEERHIEKCVQSCLPVCSEVIIVDGFSDDSTVEIAKNLGAKVFQKEWMGYGETKNYAASLAKNDWVISIDSDEVLDPTVQRSLRNFVASDSEIYAFKRLNYVGRKSIRFGEWNPDIKIRLYNRNQAKWSLDAVHEKLLYDKSVDQKIMAGTILHYSYKDIHDLEMRLDKYAKLAAKDLHAQNKGQKSLVVPFKPLLRFLKSYVLKLGFLDGRLGWQIALLNSKAVKKRYKYLKELIKKEP